MKFRIALLIIILLISAVMVTAFFACKNIPSSFNNKITLYGNPVIATDPLSEWQTVLGGSNDDIAKAIHIKDDLLYFLGESSSIDGTLTSSAGGKKLLYSKLNLNGDLKSIKIFGVSDTQNTIIKTLKINDYIYVLSDIPSQDGNAVVYKIDTKTSDIRFKMLGSKLLNENGLDLIEWNDKIYVIGKNYDSVINSNNLFICCLDYDLNIRYFERIVRGANLTYVKVIKNKDSLILWANAEAALCSYPVAIDISQNNYKYEIIQLECGNSKLLNAHLTNNGRTLLIIAVNNKNNQAAYAFVNNNKAEYIHYMSNDNAKSAEIFKVGTNYAIYIDGRFSSYYIIVNNKYYPINEIHSKPFKIISKNNNTVILANNNLYQTEFLLFYNNKITKLLLPYKNIVFADFILCENNAYLAMTIGIKINDIKIIKLTI